MKIDPVAILDDEEIVEDLPGPLPSGMDWLLPSNWTIWILGFIECWIFSREYSRLLLGTPFLLALITSGAFLWWLRHAPDDVLLANYETAIAQAQQSGELDRQENYLTALVGLRPRDPGYRFRLGQFLVENGRPEGMSHILTLVPDRTDGYPPARMWLVDQARRPEPWLELTDEQIEGQLLKILKVSPDHADTRRQLAELYLQKSEWRLAEEHLTVAARSHPELSLIVAELKQQLKRDPADIQKYLLTAEESFGSRLTADRRDVDARVALARSQQGLGKFDDAKELLLSGLQQQDHPLLRRELSELELKQAAGLLSKSGLNRDVGLQRILAAIETDPSNPSGVIQLTRLHSQGALISRESIQSSLDYWKKAAEAEPENLQPQLMLSQLLAIANAPGEAADLLQPLIDGLPELRLPMGKLLLRAGRQAEAMELLNGVIAEQTERQQADPADPAAVAALAESLLVTSRTDDALALIRDFISRGDSELKTFPVLSELYGRASLLVYDQQMAAGGFSADDEASRSDVAEALDALIQAVNCPSTALAAVERLARLSFSDHPQAERAEQLLTQLRAQGDPGGRILLMMGTNALRAERYDRAIWYLEQASGQTQKRDPGILNNLAVALVRAEKSQPERALELVNAALLLVPDQPDILSTRGEIYVALKQWQQALVDLEAALPFRRNSNVVHDLLSRVHSELGNVTLADEHRRLAEVRGPK